MRKNQPGRVLKGESKEQHLSTVPKSCSNLKHDFLGKKTRYFVWYRLVTEKDYT